MWKRAIIRPIPKKIRSSVPVDYRPIALLPIASKVLERIVAQQLKTFLNTYNILSSHQSGFRHWHSTCTALHTVTTDIRKAMDDRKVTIWVSLDFSRAFDSVNHSLLLKKLGSIGVGEQVLAWMASNLCNRHQRIVTDRGESSWKRC